MKPFSQWTKQDIEEEFGLTAVLDSPVLHSWLNDIQDVETLIDSIMPSDVQQ